MLQRRLKSHASPLEIGIEIKAITQHVTRPHLSLFDRSLSKRASFKFVLAALSHPTFTCVPTFPSNAVSPRSPPPPFSVIA